MIRSVLKKLVPLLIIAGLMWLPGCGGKASQKPIPKITQQKPVPPSQLQSMLAEEERLLENLRQQAKKEKLAAQQAAAEAQLQAEAAANKAQKEALARQKAAQEAQARQKAQQETQPQAKQQVTPSPTVPSPTVPNPVTPNPVVPNQVTPNQVTPNQTVPSPSVPSPTTPQAPQTQTPQTPQNQGQNRTTSSQAVHVLAQGGQPTVFWQQTAQSVQKLNRDWNTLQPQATKAGLNTTQSNNLKKALDKLNTAVKAQDTEKSMLAAIELFGQSGSLARVFKSPVPPEYFQLGYEIMMSAMESEKMQWSTAQARIPKMQSDWSAIKTAAKGKNAALINQTQLSISDYQKAIRARQTELVSARAETALQNLRAVEESFAAMAASRTGTTGQ